MTPSPLFNFNVVLLQTRLLSLKTTNLHFLIVTSKRYNFNFCPCLSLWTRLSNFNFACYHLSFRSTTFTTFAFASTLNHSCVNVSVLFNFRRSWLSLRLSFPFDISFFPFWLRISLRILFPSAHSASHFFCPLICFLISHLFLLVQFNSTAVIQNPDVTIHVPKTSVK